MNKKCLGFCLLFVMNIAVNVSPAGLSMVARVAALKDIANTMNKATDNYEKNEFLRQLTTFFAQRNDRAIKELEDFRDLIKFLNTDAYKQKKVFSATDVKMFEKWVRILDGTVTLLSARVSKQSLQQRTDVIKKILPQITDASAEYERRLLIPTISEMFDNRGEMNQGELKSLGDFFSVLKRTSDLLNPDQLAVLTLWIDDIANAQRVTTGTKRYIDALLEDAINTKVIAKFTKALPLFTSNTLPASRELLARGLNSLFDARRSLDPYTLLTLFKTIDQKVTSKNPLLVDRLPMLSDAQLAVLRQWIGIIEKEAPAKGA